MRHVIIFPIIVTCLFMIAIGEVGERIIDWLERYDTKI